MFLIGLTSGILLTLAYPKMMTNTQPAEEPKKVQVTPSIVPSPTLAPATPTLSPESSPSAIPLTTIEPTRENQQDDSSLSVPAPPDEPPSF
jgi:hypothetical protein